MVPLYPFSSAHGVLVALSSLGSGRGGSTFDRPIATDARLLLVFDVDVAG